MSWGIVAGAAVGVVGAAMSSDAAGDAAAGQQQASQQSNAMQMAMYNNNVALQKPTIDAGNTARSELLYRLGLSPKPGSTGKAPETYDSLRQQLTGEYTRNRQTQVTPAMLNSQDRMVYDGLARMGSDGAAQQAAFLQSIPRANLRAGGGVSGLTDLSGNPLDSGPQVLNGSGEESYIDETGLEAAIRARLAQQDADAEAARQAAAADPNYGSLAREYVAERYTPETFKFTKDDFQADPGYEFRLQQGQQALDRKAAAGGRFFSGAALTGASNFAGNMASNEFQNAYGRAAQTFGTNEGNRFGAFQANEGNRFGAYQANFNNTVNPLLALSGAATLGSQNLGSAGAAVGSQIGNTLTNQANATGAAGIASANAISSGLSGAVNNYQTNQLLGQIYKNPNATSINSNPSYGNYNGSTFDWGSVPAGTGENYLK